MERHRPRLAALARLGSSARRHPASAFEATRPEAVATYSSSLLVSGGVPRIAFEATIARSTTQSRRNRKKEQLFLRPFQPLE
jgi:hypothetical protein